MGAVKELVTTAGLRAAQKLLQEQEATTPRAVGPVYFTARWREETRSWLVERRQGRPPQTGRESGIDPDNDAVLGEVEGLRIVIQHITTKSLSKRIRSHTGENRPVRIRYDDDWVCA